jgi:lipid-binding SYLF domain-containing protein
MTRTIRVLAHTCLLAGGLASIAGSAFAGSYADTIGLFKEAGASAALFKASYAYAVFPVIAKGGFFVGGARGKGRVYEQGRYVGEATMSQISLGFQLGGQAYSEIVLLQSRRDLARFESGKLALGAQASAIAITAGASASASTTGAGASASGVETSAVTTGRFHDGIAVFTIAKGGLMYEAAVAGQKFSYQPRP